MGSIGGELNVSTGGFIAALDYYGNFGLDLTEAVYDIVNIPIGMLGDFPQSLHVTNLIGKMPHFSKLDVVEYVFVGLYTDSDFENEWDFNLPISNIPGDTVYAVWTSPFMTITPEATTITPTPTTMLEETTTTPTPTTTESIITQSGYGDRTFSFDGNYEDLDKIHLSNVLLKGNITNNGKTWNLSGYGNYNGILGVAYEGSVIVNLFADFLGTLSGGTYTLKVEFKDGTFGELDFEIDNPAATTTSTAITSVPSVTSTTQSNTNTTPNTGAGIAFIPVLIAGAVIIISKRTSKNR